MEGGDVTTEAIFNLSLKQTLQEYVVCREEFAARAEDFQRAEQLTDAALRAFAVNQLRLTALQDCRVRP
ncbi:MAG: hypothetical protein NDI90_16000 [Nitrospira sp. BO4]|nr:hypothetical protein [Nitrospira sp. BO4]